MKIHAHLPKDVCVKMLTAILFTILIGGYTVYLGYKLIKQYMSDTKI